MLCMGSTWEFWWHFPLCQYGVGTDPQAYLGTVQAPCGACLKRYDDAEVTFFLGRMMRMRRKQLSPGVRETLLPAAALMEQPPSAMVSWCLLLSSSQRMSCSAPSTGPQSTPTISVAAKQSISGTTVCLSA